MLILPGIAKEGFIDLNKPLWTDCLRPTARRMLSGQEGLQGRRSGVDLGSNSDGGAIREGDLGQRAGPPGIITLAHIIGQPGQLPE